MEFSENSKNLRFGVTILAYVLSAALFFGVGYMSGSRNQKKQSVNSVINKTEAVSANAENEKDLSYRVKIENGRLYLYEIDGEEITSIAECEISESVYPSEDIKELMQGIDFRSKDEAQAMFENFSS